MLQSFSFSGNLGGNLGGDLGGDLGSNLGGDLGGDLRGNSGGNSGGNLGGKRGGNSAVAPVFRDVHLLILDRGPLEAFKLTLFGGSRFPSQCRNICFV